MRIAIAGGHGTVAMETTRLLTQRGIEVASVIRKASQAGDIEAVGGQPIVADLESLDGAELTEAIGTVDAVLFAAGAGPGSGAERKQTVDHDGAVKFIEVARRGGAGHYVMLGSMGADPDHEGDDVFDVYLRAKGAADRDLRASGVGYTIVRPTRLTDDDPVGVVELSADASGDAISRADVAAVLAEVLVLDEPTNETLQLTAGTTPVDQAVEVIATGSR
ncbi:NAD(P)H-binding protein [Ilumatobacter nonamiensis]|uniref:NAD(P)H-binding protein n=1 Tax=Ilumatobacter nonamiensis TaxID=467093 RepID=UPI00034B24A0|nr:NAD(P)H-binding protein [Ilumatobacter nonamiensis]